MAKRSREDFDDGTADIAELGTQLKALREAQCLSYDDVAKATRVRPHLLKAIEDGSIEKIAAPVYARGFVKTYCECLLADDLWRKYCRYLKPQEAVEHAGRDSSVDINHPTPMFRRSSIIWVYVLLVFAVIGAAFLLWSQQKDQEGIEHGASLMSQDSGGAVSGDAGASSDIPAIPEAIAGVTSRDLASVPIPRAASPDAAGTTASGGASEGLSWMGVEITAASESSRIPVVRQMASRQELLVEIKGRTRLVVNQGGRNITTRELTAGDSRTYYVNSDTEVRLGVGNAADITWFGKKYERVGDGGPLTMIFYPDGSVKMTSGKSDFFGPERRTSQ